jgi:SAM-dependent methyltransferase
VLADVGAGSGGYSRAFADRGFGVKAIEPSGVMRAQATPHPRVEWLTGTAERLPLPSASVDGAVCILALHHFASVEAAVTEMARVTSGPIVSLTFDPRAAARFWLQDYFPSVWADAYRVFPPLERIASAFELGGARAVTAHAFLLPHDLRDLFAASGWRRPHLCLDPQVRASMSCFALADQAEIGAQVERLRADLASGDWARAHGWVLGRQRLDAGYRLLCAVPRW